MWSLHQTKCDDNDNDSDSDSDSDDVMIVGTIVLQNWPLNKNSIHPISPWYKYWWDDYLKSCIHGILLMLS